MKSEIAAIIPKWCVIDETLLDALVVNTNVVERNWNENEQLRKRCEELEKRNPLGGETLEKLREILGRFNDAYKNCNTKLTAAREQMDDCYSGIDYARDELSDADGNCDRAKARCDEADKYLSEMGGAIVDLDSLVNALAKEAGDGENAVSHAD
jgi:chromosome segregation ATPase